MIDEKNSESPANEQIEADSGSGTKQAIQCANCINANDQLEQLFSCLFGYKKSRVKYLSTHKVEKIDFTLENSLNVYRYFKPEKLPEYDSLKKIGIEVPVHFN